MIDGDHSSGLPGSPPGSATPLQPISSDRANQQRDPASVASARSDHQRDSDVHDKIRQFNNMTHNGPAGAASMSRQLERKTADAALKRAMLGREEAEAEMRRYRDEARSLRKQIEESRARERKVGERLEDVMEKYGQAKETLQHSKAIWEKEVRQARKELFKTQSAIVKLQEELKVVKAASKSIEESLAREKELSKAREQEAFQSRYQLANMQEQLEKALERIAFVEQERDAYKAAAKSEEIARIAAEGRLPLPPEDPDSEFASPKKERVSLSAVDILSSAASEAEIEELTRLWQWEKQRADRAQEHLEFVKAECELRCCSCSKTPRPRRSARSSIRQERPKSIAVMDPADLMILGQEAGSSEQRTPTQAEHPDQEQERQSEPSQPEIIEPPEESTTPREEPEIKLPKGPRRSTIFVPSEGIFRTVSQQELEAMGKTVESIPEPPTPVDSQPDPPRYCRTPSVEPPTFALLAQERTSLLSLLNAPHEGDSQCMPMKIPTIPIARHADLEQDEEEATRSDPEPEAEAEAETEADAQAQMTAAEHDAIRPHTSAAFFTVTKTTTVPVREDNYRGSHSTNSYRSSSSEPPSFDVNNPALTPTMTREQALAMIKERRGRARSAAQGLATPKKQMVKGAGERRDLSAPGGRKGRSA
ncbi:uncharacterized protein F4807DRAFT_440163 [Annulohypoxylon truncatum]|uniref:uncharacterized protein n=1 Tax=Annulohypoxylon truncatum TaxID=327061 RepID=UPI0020075F80|nr:uncharacterized protein F4807DRAFT_440163 [Annulohypoxylon truncatum]KAI1206178.1 hypothetical protein F4807DRAFT_440163 [Annulohypoxylon truncatum]